MISNGLQVNIDWLTVTTKSDAIGRQWRAIFYDVSRPKESFIPWSFYGYEGYSFDGLSWGQGPHGWIIRASGMANVDGLFVRIVGHKPSLNVTRLDLAVTVPVEEKLDDLVVRHYDKIVEEGIEGLNRQYVVIKNTRGGQTLYVGSRSSTQFGRLYDKGAQLGETPGLLYRYEVELKKPRASIAASQLLEWARSGDDVSYRVRMCRYVYDWFLNRGITPIFERPDNGDQIDFAISHRESSLDGKLWWLRAQVRPAVAKLVKRGLESEVREALELGNHPYTVCKECGQVFDKM